MIRDKYKKILFIDFETRSEVEVADVGAHRYASHPTTEMVLVSYAFDNGEAVVSSEMTEGLLQALESSEVLKVAHNAEFDMCIAKYVLGVDITHTDWYDTAFLAAYYGRPRKLAFLAHVLRTKAKASPEEMLYYAKPIKQTKKEIARGDVIKFNYPKTFYSAELLGSDLQPLLPDLGADTSTGLCQELARYRQLLARVSKKQQQVTELELLSNPTNLYQLGEAGVYDKPLLDELVEVDKTLKFRLYAVSDVEVMRECMGKMHPLPGIEIFVMQYTFKMNFTGVPFDLELASRIEAKAQEYAATASQKALKEYGIENLRSTAQVKHALFLQGTLMPTLNKKERAGKEHPILELRDQATGAAFAKIKTAKARICADGRLHGEFVGFGAHTGRWSSRGVQLQNFARGAEDTSADLSQVRDYNHLRQHLRLCIHGAGMQFVCADLSQIEARITAWLANCEWRMEAFAQDVDIYSRSAERMFNLPEVHKGMPERQMGKCAELGFGFGGAVGALERVAPGFCREVGEEKVLDLVRKWRSANPEICTLWRKIEDGFRRAMRDGVCVLTVADGVRLPIRYDGRTALVGLPSGRGLYYPGVRTDENRNLYYADYSRNGEHGTQTKLWGGTLTENIVQAIATDVIVDIMKRIDKKFKYMCVGTVHDEAWFISDDPQALANVLAEMAEPVKWAPGLITKGDGFTADRYIK